MTVCTICERDTPQEYLEKHHLTPKSRRGKETIPVCCDCGNQVHRLFTLKQLERRYNTIESLKSDERMQRWIAWAQRRPRRFKFCHKTLKRK